MKKKIISLCLAAALAVTALGGASLAYFTDKDAKTNTFTLGRVDIEL
ncbi:MAG: TasA family protein, partial [Acutalibacteraceae bacterium]